MEHADNSALASRWARFGAAIVDGLVWILVAVIASFSLTPDYGYGYSSYPSDGPIIAIGIAVVAILAINMFLLYSRGQTIGKMALGITIVDMNNQQARLLKVIFLRWLPVALISAIPFVGGIFAIVNILLIFRDDKRCIHDLFAGTQVIKRSYVRGAEIQMA
ncbi:RDD family protein [Vibrio intestinalis]|uniref:RDD family protein n=1 Tax=Vibrio intestinalis TaxID=2933291 RepID=UPI0021A33AD7|nr:RDD family protein [Vibrio intestinalis]